jgi:phosphoglycerate dehydrogenase-like enzyme
VLADELVWASDVWDVEPLPADDPLRGRANVLHTPHIAGRTRDAQEAVARILVEDFIAVLAGRPPRHPLTPAQVRVRLGAPSLRHVPEPPAEIEVVRPILRRRS